MTSVTLKVFVDKDELDNLKRIAAQHEKYCKKRITSNDNSDDNDDAVLKNGSGEVTLGPEPGKSGLKKVVFLFEPDFFLCGNRKNISD